jgi:peptidoglycan/LPS O-acetylase OafA/YrhL
MVNVRVASDPSYFSTLHRPARRDGTVLISGLSHVSGCDSLRPWFGGFGPIMDPAARTGWTWIGDATLSAGLLQSPVTGERTFWLGHAWSLSYEEQFYAVIGVLLAFSQRRWLRTAGLITVALTAIQVWNPRAMPNGGGFLNGHWQLFALGLALFHWRVRALGATRLLVPIAVVLAAGWAVLQENFGATHFSTELAAAAIATALMTVLSRHDLALYRAPVLSGLRWCGERCYSVYLVHWPVTKAITGLALWAGLTSPFMILCGVLPAALAVSLVGAAFFHAIIERRFLNSSLPSVSAHSPPSSIYWRLLTTGSRG